jgi:hypothetical protein
MLSKTEAADCYDTSRGLYFSQCMPFSFQPPSKIYLGIAIPVIVLALGYALFLSGSPAKERQRIFDERRANDLEMISSAIDNYFSSKETAALLPDLNAYVGKGTYIPSVLDPETQVPYEYHPLDKDSYELCAIFGTDTLVRKANDPIVAPMRLGVDFRRHGIGRTCFTVKVIRTKAFIPDLATIITPANGGKVSGTDALFDALVTSPQGLADSVDFLVTNESGSQSLKAQHQTTGHWTAIVDSHMFTDGVYAVTARASFGERAVYSSTVVFTIQNAPAPKK